MIRDRQLEMLYKVLLAEARPVPPQPDPTQRARHVQHPVPQHVAHRRQRRK